VHPALVVKTKPFGALRGKLALAGRTTSKTDKPPGLEQARVVLIDADKGGRSEHSLESAQEMAWDEVAGSTSGFEFMDLQPGVKRLLVWIPGATRLAEEHVRISAGKWTELREPLALMLTRPSSRSLPVKDVREEGVYAPLARAFARVNVRDLRLPWPRWFLPIVGDEIDASGLPDARFDVWKVTLAAAPDARSEHEPNAPFAESSAAPAALDSKLVKLGFAAFDGHAHAPLSDFAVTFGPAGQMLHAEERAAGVQWDCAKGTRLFVGVWASGRAPRFEWIEVGAPNKRSSGPIVEVRLSNGFGAQLSLRELPASEPSGANAGERVRPAGEDLLVALSRAAPIGGVTMHVDGQPNSVSTAAGDLFVSGPIMPRRMTLACESWRLVQLERVPGPGLRYVGWMERVR
jgi:hypothetical protein